MSITTYAELQTAIGNWLERSDLTSRIPEFIDLFEARCNRELRTPYQEVRSQATADSEYLALPTDFLSLRAITIEGTPDRALQYVTPDEYRAKLDSSLTGKPYFYTIEDEQFKFLPVPDTSYTCEIIYIAKIAALSDANTSNWLLASHPDLYLRGSLAEASFYIVDDPRTEKILIWVAGEMERLSMQGNSARMGARMRQKVRDVY